MASTPFIRVPPEHYSGVQKFASLTNEQAEALLATLQSAKPALSPQGLVAEITPKFGDLKRYELRDMIETLVAMYAVRTKAKLSTTEFAEGIKQGLLDSEDSELTEEELDRLTQRLPAFLSLERPLGVTSKASDVLTQHQHTFCNVRILTDVRPVFGDDLATIPSDAVMTQTLKIGYHENGVHKEFFVAMDSEDLYTLKSAVERAELKARSAKAMLEKANISYIDVELKG